MRLCFRHTLAGLAAAAFAVSAHAQTTAPEHDLKAAFIYNFIQFTQWPAAALTGGTLNLCVSPGTILHMALQPIAGKAVHGQIIALMPLQADQLKSCHVVVAEQLDRPRAQQLRKNMESLPILSITDDPELMREGFIIGMGVDNGKVTFSIDNSRATDARLALSSRLLRLARSVR